MTASVITAWDTYSPLGDGAQAHLAALRDAAPPDHAPPDHPAPDHASPAPRTRLDEFETRTVLGRSGTRAMDKTAGLAVATTRLLLDRVGAPFGGYPPEELGLVLGVSDNVKSVTEFVRDTWTRSKPFDVDPAHIPRTLMNYAAGQCAIWHGVKGPNATVCGSHATGLLALNYARRLQRNGHASATIWGAVEEYSDARAAVEAARSDGSGGPPPGEGCVMFLLEQAGSVGDGRAPLAEVLAVEFGIWTGQDAIRPTLARCIRRALRRSQAEPTDVFAVAPAWSAGPYADTERAAATDVLAAVPSLTTTADTIGDTRAASAAFQIVELLAHPGASGRIGLATTVDEEGRTGCALLRVH